MNITEATDTAVVLRELAGAVKAGVELDDRTLAACERLAVRAAKPLLMSASAFWPDPQ